MNATPPQLITPHASAKKRRGVVIVAVLVVIVLLSLAGYQYADMTLAEYKASENAHRLVQARALAGSGVHFAMAMTSRTANLNNIEGNLWNNPLFKDVELKGDDGKVIGRFSLIAPPEADDTAGQVRFGLECEAGKLNLNAMMKLDPTGKTLNGMLMKLPIMTADIAAAIVDWLDPDSEAKAGGAESDYYSSLSPSYRARNGPIESLDELLLVKGMTRELLYGNDLNRNGIQDANEMSDDGGGFSRGWSALLTVHSREQNRDLESGTLVWINNTDLKQLYEGLAQYIGDEELAKFIVMYRQYASADVDAALPKGTTIGSLANYQVKFDRRAAYQVNSIYDLIGVRIQRGKVIYTSPLNDPAKLSELLPGLLMYGKLADVPEIVARVNVNTAPREVLLTIPGLTAADVDKIMQTRPRLSATETTPEIFDTQAWLVTDAKFSANQMRSLDMYLGGTSQVYRVQAVGQLTGRGPTVRIEAVIDTNAGRPRIIAWRDLTELGKGLNEQPAR